MADSVRAFLASLKLEQYVDNFLQNGYDEESSLKSIDEKDLDAMNITLPGHRKRLLQNAPTWSHAAAQAAPPAPAEEEPKAAEVAQPARAKPSVAPPPRPVSSVNPPVPPRTPDKPPALPERAPPAPLDRAPPALPERPPALPERPPALPDRPPPLPDRQSVPQLPIPIAPTVPTIAPAPPATAAVAAPPVATGPPALPAKSNTPSAKRISGLPDGPAEDDHAQVPLDIVREATGVLMQVRISHTTTAKQALDRFVSSMNSQRIDPTASWQFYEVFETPPVERQLADDEVVLEAKLAWPRTEGCRFVVREIQPDLIGQAHPTVQGKLDKRGGSHKSWKTRHFILQPDRDLAYYAKTPKAKEMDNPIGTFTLDNKCLVYEVRHLRKAPRVDLCFCLKQFTNPLWPGDTKEKVMDHFEEHCKFMCAFTPEERNIWIASIRKVIKESKFADKAAAARPMSPGDSSDEEEKKEDKKEEAEEPTPPLPSRPAPIPEPSASVAAASAPPAATVASPVPVMPSVVPTAAAGGPPMPAPRERPAVAPRPKTEGVPEDFVPIKPKPVMGVGFGNIQVALPRRIQGDD